MSTYNTLGDIEVGRVVILNVGGTPTRFIIVNQGLPNTSYDSSCNGTWLLAENCVTTTVKTAYNYINSSAHTYLNDNFYNSLDDKIKTAIKEVIIPINNEGDDYDDDSLTTKIFLLSFKEVGKNGGILSSDPNANNVPGTLSYFTTYIKRIAKYNGYTIRWWTRTSQY